MGVLGEADQLDVAGAIIIEDGGRHTVDGDLSAFDGHFEGLHLSAPEDLDHHFGAFRAAQVLHHLIVGDPDPGE